MKEEEEQPTYPPARLFEMPDFMWTPPHATHSPSAMDPGKEEDDMPMVDYGPVDVEQERKWRPARLVEYVWTSPVASDVAAGPPDTETLLDAMEDVALLSASRGHATSPDYAPAVLATSPGYTLRPGVAQDWAEFAAATPGDHSPAPRLEDYTEPATPGEMHALFQEPDIGSIVDTVIKAHPFMAATELHTPSQEASPHPLEAHLHAAEREIYDSQLAPAVKASVQQFETLVSTVTLEDMLGNSAEPAHIYNWMTAVINTATYLATISRVLRLARDRGLKMPIPDFLPECVEKDFRRPIDKTAPWEEPCPRMLKCVVLQMTTEMGSPNPWIARAWTPSVIRKEHLRWRAMRLSGEMTHEQAVYEATKMKQQCNTNFLCVLCHLKELTEYAAENIHDETPPPVHQMFFHLFDKRGEYSSAHALQSADAFVGLMAAVIKFSPSFYVLDPEGVYPLFGREKLPQLLVSSDVLFH